MKALLGMDRVGPLADFLASQKPSDLQLDTVQTREQLMFRLQENYDYVAVHCNLFCDVYPWDWIQDLQQKSPDMKVTIILDEKVYDSTLLDVVRRLSQEYGFETVPIGLPDVDLAASLGVFFFDRSAAAQENLYQRQGKVVVTWSAASKDGASTIAVNTAIALSNLTELSVGLIDLNLKSPGIRADLNIQDRDKSNLKLRPKLLTQSLEPSELLNMCVKYRNLSRLHILAGTHRRDTALDVTPEMVQHLLTVAKKTFDITIVDVHTFPDNAATICAVRNADIRWLVTQNNYASYKASWGEWLDCYWRHCGIQLTDISLIVNKANPHDKSSLVSEHMGIELLSEIPNMGPESGLRAVHEGIPLLHQSENTSFVDSVNQLAAELAAKIGSDVKLQQKKKQTWFQRVAASLFA